MSMINYYFLKRSISNVSPWLIGSFAKCYLAIIKPFLMREREDMHQKTVDFWHSNC